MGHPAALPPAAAEALRPALPHLADEIIATIAREVPAYERAMEGAFGQVVRLGVEVALGRFVDGRERLGREELETYVNLGRGEFHAGRSLDALLGAYRVGARLAWRRFVEAGVAAGLDPGDMYRIGEAIFEYIDELSAESAEGYALEQRAEAGGRRRRRRRLVERLTAEPPAGEDEVRAAAADAGWELPRELAALAVDVGEEDVEDAAERLARELGHGVVAAAYDGAALALVPDPGAPGRRRGVEAAVAGRSAALGPVVPWTGAARSVRFALGTLRLAGHGAPAGRLLDAGDHLPTLLLRADAEAAADLARSRLAPLTSLPAPAAERLRETLRAWLDRPGQVQAIAAALGVHPQTVRYRLRQLRELFGARLEDPDARFELALALRAADAEGRR
ncbi:MAG TPA: helix-turn-helix domain-containing protein [Solirubrobacteraceae bacterium]|nr:helix-turn-helix domain-containing protein [Solirubrobacteraceae bacterium]